LKIETFRMHHIVFVTAPSIEVARELASGILENCLAACVNLVPGVESHYWWEGKLCEETEVLMVMKTTGEKLAALEAFVLAAHPYDTPEFVALKIESGSARYLDWISGSVGLGSNL
jgi:periplasmic divalent cation tolerance protein